jgi:Zn-dependent protease with chaperone function
MSTLAGLYYDGKSAQAWPVEARVHEHKLALYGDGALVRECDLRECVTTDALGKTARTVLLPGHGSVTFTDSAQANVALARSPHAESVVAKLARNRSTVLAALVMFVLVVALGYRYALPWTAQQIAHALPPKALDLIADSALDVLPSMGFVPSKLPAARQQKLVDGFSKLAPHDGTTRARRILFRANPEMGANAVALPDGTIVVTDELVALAQNDDQIYAVLCHELGHVAHRHGAQLVVEGAIIAGFLSLYLGDFSTVAAGAATTLATAHYSRQSEREADDYAIAMLKHNGRSPRVFSAMLNRMDHAYRAEKKKNADAKKRNIGDYFSSHPGTGERISRIESAAP